MKRLIAAALLWVALPVFATDAPWTTSVPGALARAKKENKLVLLNFTGSDWCVGCLQFQTNVFSKLEFLDYAKTNLVLVELDFPLKKKVAPEIEEANDALQVKYKVEGYPTLFLLKPDGTQLWTHAGYISGGPPALIQILEQARKK